MTRSTEQQLPSELHESLSADAPTVLVADRQPALAWTRSALEREGFTVVAAAESADEAVDAAIRTTPQLCVVAMEVPGGGLRAAREIQQAGLETEIAVLSDQANELEALACIRAGANGYMPRTAVSEPYGAALRAMLRGEAVLPRAFGAALVTELRRWSQRRTYGRGNRAVFYVPRFVKHLRRRLRSAMPWGDAWRSARMRMHEYR